jgi:NAD(P)H-dependent FMN reductase
MGKKVVAVVGSYRKGGTIDTVVDAMLASAKANGAETVKIDLFEKHVEFCTNCRACTQTDGAQHGECVHKDDLESILAEIESADSLVLGAPVNFFNVTAIFRRFMERLVAYAYWPWGAPSPVNRIKTLTRKAAVVTSAAMPGLFIPIATGAPRALKVTAKVLGANTVASMCIGLAAKRAPTLSPRTLAKARRIGAMLA